MLIYSKKILNTPLAKKPGLASHKKPSPTSPVWRNPCLLSPPPSPPLRVDHSDDPRPATWAPAPSAEKKKLSPPAAEQKHHSLSGTDLTVGAALASLRAATAYQSTTLAAACPAAVGGDYETSQLDFLDAQLRQLEREVWREKIEKEKWGKRSEAVKKAEEENEKKREGGGGGREEEGGRRG